MPIPLVGPVLLGAGAYYLARKGRQEQLAKDVAAQSKAAAGFGGSRRKKHHGGVHGDFCPGCVGFGAVGARPAPPAAPAVQRTTGIALVARPAPPIGRTVPGLTYGGGGWTAASAKAAGERMALANDLAYTGFAPDDGYDLDGYADQSYDRPVAEETLYYDRRDDRHRHWY
jgi:hypothetical protein